MNRKLLTYGPVVLLALLCAAAFATGVLTRYPVLEAQVQAMDFPNGTAVSLENGDVYGVVPSGGPGHSLSAGTYRLKWFVDGDGDNALHLYSENGVKMEPETVILPAGQFEGEFEFTLDSAISGLQLQFEFAAGTYMEIYDVRIYTPGCSDNAFTLLFASLAFSLIWVAVRRGRLRTAQIEGMLMIGLAVLFASAPAFQETLHIGDDIQYHLCRIENIVDAWRCGQFPARLGAYIYDGYGALTSIFYPDYFLYPFALMSLCGASLAYVGNVMLICLNIGAAAGMYAAAKRMFGDHDAAVASAALYVLAAYRLTDVYARFAVGEATAMVFLPLFIAALMVFPPVYLNVLEGIRRTDASLLEMARVFRVPFSRTLRGVYLPQVLPYFRSAVSAALGLCWKAGTAAEVIALSSGSIGEKLYNAKIYFQTADLFAWTAAIVLISAAFEKLFLLLVDKIAERMGA